MATKFLNVNEIVPEEQILIIGDRKFDISNTPARKTTELLRIGSWAMSPEIKNDPSRNYEAYIEELKALMDVLGTDEDGVVADLNWLLDNVSNVQMRAIVDFIGDCLSGEEENIPDGETPANFTPNRQTRRSSAKRKK